MKKKRWGKAARVPSRGKALRFHGAVFPASKRIFPKEEFALFSQMSFTVSGDALILHRLPENYPGRQAIRDYLRRGQARITNLETTLTKGDCCPSTFSGGTWLTAEKDVL